MPCKRLPTAAGHKVTHVKAHGALSNVACEDDMTAKAIASAIKAVDPNLVFVVLANSKLVQAGEAANLPMVHEVFADRAYEDNGTLVSRKKDGAVLHDAKQIADRVVRMVQDGAVVSVTGKVIKMRIDTVCIHGDTPGAVEIGRGVRQALEGCRDCGGAVQDGELERVNRQRAEHDGRNERERAIERGHMKARPGPSGQRAGIKVQTGLRR